MRVGLTAAQQVEPGSPSLQHLFLQNSFRRLCRPFRLCRGGFCRGFFGSCCGNGRSLCDAGRRRSDRITTDSRDSRPRGGFDGGLSRGLRLPGSLLGGLRRIRCGLKLDPEVGGKPVT